MTPEQLLHNVTDRDSFIQFVRAMAAEREAAQEIERQNPIAYGVDGALNWKNADIASFLYAGLEAIKPSVNEPSWQLFADFLYHGKIIE